MSRFRSTRYVMTEVDFHEWQKGTYVPHLKLSHLLPLGGIAVRLNGRLRVWPTFLLYTEGYVTVRQW